MNEPLDPQPLPPPENSPPLPMPIPKETETEEIETEETETEETETEETETEETETEETETEEIEIEETETEEIELEEIEPEEIEVEEIEPEEIELEEIEPEEIEPLEENVPEENIDLPEEQDPIVRGFSVPPPDPNELVFRPENLIIFENWVNEEVLPNVEPVEVDLDYLGTLTWDEIEATGLTATQIEGAIFAELEAIIISVIGDVLIEPETEFSTIASEEEVDEIVDEWFKRWEDILTDLSEPETMDEFYPNPILVKDLVHVIWYTLKEFDLTLPYEELQEYIAETSS